MIIDKNRRKVTICHYHLILFTNNTFFIFNEDDYRNLVKVCIEEYFVGEKSKNKADLTSYKIHPNSVEIIFQVRSKTKVEELINNIKNNLTDKFFKNFPVMQSIMNEQFWIYNYEYKRVIPPKKNEIIKHQRE
jgi:REP element-mobilizing transposase RayT